MLTLGLHWAFFSFKDRYSEGYYYTLKLTKQGAKNGELGTGLDLFTTIEIPWCTTLQLVGMH